MVGGQFAPASMVNLNWPWVVNLTGVSNKQGPKLKQHANFATTLKHYINEIEIVKYITKDRSRNRFKVFE
jgi:hypothetical protein